jgi:hypothetical protein
MVALVRVEAGEVQLETAAQLQPAGRPGSSCRRTSRRTSRLDRKWTVSSRPACPGRQRLPPTPPAGHVAIPWRTFMLDDHLIIDRNGRGQCPSRSVYVCVAKRTAALRVCKFMSSRRRNAGCYEPARRALQYAGVRTLLQRARSLIVQIERPRVVTQERPPQDSPPSSPPRASTCW